MVRVVGGMSRLGALCCNAGGTGSESEGDEEVWRVTCVWDGDVPSSAYTIIVLPEQGRAIENVDGVPV